MITRMGRRKVVTKKKDGELGKVECETVGVMKNRNQNRITTTTFGRCSVHAGIGFILIYFEGT